MSGTLIWLVFDRDGKFLEAYSGWGKALERLTELKLTLTGPYIQSVELHT